MEGPTIDCPRCGCEVSAAAYRCPACGLRLDLADVSTRAMRRSGRTGGRADRGRNPGRVRLRWAVLAVLVAAMILGLAAVSVVGVW